MTEKTADNNQKPSPKKLKQFIDRGGYALLERMGTGANSEERQTDAWSKHGIITQLARQTGIARPTLYAIKASFPTLKTTGVEMFWLNKETLSLLNEARDKLLTAEKLLNRISEIAERSLIVDSTKVRMQQQILGLSIEEAFKNVVKEAEEGKNPIEDAAKELIRDLRDTLSIINHVQYSAKKIE